MVPQMLLIFQPEACGDIFRGRAANTSAITHSVLMESALERCLKMISVQRLAEALQNL